jgi:serine/threonine protein kinase
MGEVYRAPDTRLGREVAIKILGSRHAVNPARRDRFLQEARTTSALNHANIVALYNSGNENGADFLVMELVRGKTLDQLPGSPYPSPLVARRNPRTTLPVRPLVTSLSIAGNLARRVTNRFGRSTERRLIVDQKQTSGSHPEEGFNLRGEHPSAEPRRSGHRMNRCLV